MLISEHGSSKALYLLGTEDLSHTVIYLFVGLFLELFAPSFGLKTLSINRIKADRRDMIRVQ